MANVSIRAREEVVAGMNRQYSDLVRIGQEVGWILERQRREQQDVEREDPGTGISMGGNIHWTLNAPQGWHYSVSPWNEGEVENCPVVDVFGGSITGQHEFSQERPLIIKRMVLTVLAEGDVSLEMLGELFHGPEPHTQQRHNLEVTGLPLVKNGEGYRIEPTPDQP